MLAALCNGFQLNQQDGEQTYSFFPVKPSTPMAQFWLNNIKISLRGKHLKEKVGTNPPWREGWLIAVKQAIREEFVFWFLKAGRGSWPVAPICYWAEITATPLQHACVHLSTMTRCFLGLTRQSECQQTGCFQWFCSESWICHCKIMLIAKPQLFMPISTLGRLLFPASI